MDHRLTHVFGSGFLLHILDRNAVHPSIISDQFGIMYRDISGTLLEIIDGIASYSHHFLNELVGLLQGYQRLIDKSSLRFLPFKGVAIHLVGSECPDIKRFYVSNTFLQFLLRPTLIANFIDHTVVFRTKPL